jgi:hypothetical protein
LLPSRLVTCILMAKELSSWWRSAA